MIEKINLSEGDIFLLTPPLKSDPCYACHLIYLSRQTKGLYAYILSKEPVNLESLDVEYPFLVTIGIATSLSRSCSSSIINISLS